MAVASAALLAAAGYALWPAATPPEQLLAQARRALAAKDYAAAENYCRRLLARQPGSTQALLLAGEAATKQDHLSEALTYYAQLPTDAGKDAAVGYAAAGDILVHLHQASAAEAQFRQALAIDPRLLFAHRRLGYLLGLEGRRWESVPHLFEMLRQDQFSLETLLLLGNHAAAVELPEELKQFREAAPDDPLPLIGEARLAIRRTRIAEAKRMLQTVLAKAPDQLEAEAELGLLLVMNADPDLQAWLVASAPAAEAHPDVWMTRGVWAKQRGDTRGAARCFWEAVRRDATHQAATYQLAQALESLGDSETARQLSDRAARLQKLASVTDLLFSKRDDLALLQSAAQLTESLGCLWEAWGWNLAALGVDPQASWAKDGSQRLQAELQGQPPLVLDSANPAKQIDLSSYPIPNWSAGPAPARPPSDDSMANYRATFKDLAAQAGIEFSYFSGRESHDDGRRMFEFTGGGVAVLDYDADGWPDVYLTQGCRWPPVARQTEHLDRLYRNLGDGRFEDVTFASGLAEDRFSQGAAAGDFDNDGFADLYVANVGVNRLYLNQGDGTFRDVGA
ncbi:MAG TPA: FG-GAP-like repeat-containing protein, partial [Pirellulales bacterium]|nr:FG-GAP-like repeat-containing protein [Pirellulales bacterium]